MKNKTIGMFGILFFFIACIVPALKAQSVFVQARIADADIINAGSLFDPMADRVKDLSPSVFSLTFINRTSPKRDALVTMHLEAWATLDEDREPMLLYTMDSKAPFLVPIDGRVFTSADSRGSGDMQFSTVSNEQNIQRLKDKIWDPASGGRVPSGRYELKTQLTVVKIGADDAHEQVPVYIPPVIVSNPTVASLIIPSANGHEFPTQFPQFQWTSNTRKVRLTVFELRPGQSIDDAAQGSDPYMQVEIDRERTGGLSAFTYPQTEVSTGGVEMQRAPRPLEQGKQYVLVLDGLREAFGTTVDPLREIRSFSIADLQGQSRYPNYRTIFTGPEYQEVVTRLESDNTFFIDPEGVTKNSNAMSLDELKTFLDRNRHRKITIHIEE